MYLVDSKLSIKTRPLSFADRFLFTSQNTLLLLILDAFYQVSSISTQTSLIFVCQLLKAIAVNTPQNQ
jgi:hypothetical protein